MVASGEVVVVDQNEDETREAPIHGDTLEAILSHVPLVDLVAASRVSKPWKRAVSSSLRSLNRLKPWLVVHRQNTRSRRAAATRAYDPSSRAWVDIRLSPAAVDLFSDLRSSHSSLLFMLSPSRLSFSSDPLHLAWHHAASGPLVWRRDPVVALVGRRVVVAGGVCEFGGGDPLAAEIYDVESRAWGPCEPMPSSLAESASSTWLSAATDNNRLFVAEKYSGVAHALDPETQTWCGPYDLRPDPAIFFSVITIADDRLILIGLIGDADDLKGLKLWEVNCESFSCEEIEEMPEEFVEKLKREDGKVTSICACSAENMIYMYNPSEMEEVFVCELVAGGGSVWGSVRNDVAGDRNWSERFVMTCSKVGIDDLCRAAETVRTGRSADGCESSLVSELTREAVLRKCC